MNKDIDIMANNNNNNNDSIIIDNAITIVLPDNVDKDEFLFLVSELIKNLTTNKENKDCIDNNINNESTANISNDNKREMVDMRLLIENVKKKLEENNKIMMQLEKELKKSKGREIELKVELLRKERKQNIQKIMNHMLIENIDPYHLYDHYDNNMLAHLLYYYR